MRAPWARPKSALPMACTDPPTVCMTVSSSDMDAGTMWVMWWVAPLSMTQSVVRGGHGGEDDPENAQANPGPVTPMDESQLLPSGGSGHMTNALGPRIDVRLHFLIGVGLLSQAPGTATGGTDEGEEQTASIGTKLVRGEVGEVSEPIPLVLQGEGEQEGGS